MSGTAVTWTYGLFMVGWNTGFLVVLHQIASRIPVPHTIAQISELTEQALGMNEDQSTKDNSEGTTGDGYDQSNKDGERCESPSQQELEKRRSERHRRVLVEGLSKSKMAYSSRLLLSGADLTQEKQTWRSKLMIFISLCWYHLTFPSYPVTYFRPYHHVDLSSIEEIRTRHTEKWRKQQWQSYCIYLRLWQALAGILGLILCVLVLTDIAVVYLAAVVSMLISRDNWWLGFLCLLCLHPIVDVTAFYTSHSFRALTLLFENKVDEQQTRVALIWRLGNFLLIMFFALVHMSTDETNDAGFLETYLRYSSVFAGSWIVMNLSCSTMFTISAIYTMRYRLFANVDESSRDDGTGEASVASTEEVLLWKGRQKLWQYHQREYYNRIDEDLYRKSAKERKKRRRKKRRDRQRRTNGLAGLEDEDGYEYDDGNDDDDGKEVEMVTMFDALKQRPMDKDEEIKKGGKKTILLNLNAAQSDTVIPELPSSEMDVDNKPDDFLAPKDGDEEVGYERGCCSICAAICPNTTALNMANLENMIAVNAAEAMNDNGDQSSIIPSAAESSLVYYRNIIINKGEKRLNVYDKEWYEILLCTATIRTDERGGINLQHARVYNERMYLTCLIISAIIFYFILALICGFSDSDTGEMIYGINGLGNLPMFCSLMMWLYYCLIILREYKFGALHKLWKGSSQASYNFYDHLYRVTSVTEDLKKLNQWELPRLYLIQLVEIQKRMLAMAKDSSDLKRAKDIFSDRNVSGQSISIARKERRSHHHSSFGTVKTVRHTVASAWEGAATLARSNSKNPNEEDDDCLDDMSGDQYLNLELKKKNEKKMVDLFDEKRRISGLANMSADLIAARNETDDLIATFPAFLRDLLGGDGSAASGSRIRTEVITDNHGKLSYKALRYSQPVMLDKQKRYEEQRDDSLIDDEDRFGFQSIGTEIFKQRDLNGVGQVEVAAGKKVMVRKSSEADLAAVKADRRIQEKGMRHDGINEGKPAFRKKSVPDEFDPIKDFPSIADGKQIEDLGSVAATLRHFVSFAELGLGNVELTTEQPNRKYYGKRRKKKRRRMTKKKKVFKRHKDDDMMNERGRSSSAYVQRKKIQSTSVGTYDGSSSSDSELQRTSSTPAALASHQRHTRMDAMSDSEEESLRSRPWWGRDFSSSSSSDTDLFTSDSELEEYLEEKDPGGDYITIEDDELIVDNVDASQKKRKFSSLKKARTDGYRDHDDDDDEIVPPRNFGAVSHPVTDHDLFIVDGSRVQRHSHGLQASNSDVASAMDLLAVRLSKPASEMASELATIQPDSVLVTPEEETAKEKEKEDPTNDDECGTNDNPSGSPSSSSSSEDDEKKDPTEDGNPVTSIPLSNKEKTRRVSAHVAAQQSMTIEHPLSMITFFLRDSILTMNVPWIEFWLSVPSDDGDDPFGSGVFKLNPAKWLRTMYLFLIGMIVLILLVIVAFLGTRIDTNKDTFEFDQNTNNDVFNSYGSCLSRDPATGFNILDSVYVTIAPELITGHELKKKNNSNNNSSNDTSVSSKSDENNVRQFLEVWFGNATYEEFFNESSLKVFDSNPSFIAVSGLPRNESVDEGRRLIQNSGSRLAFINGPTGFSRMVGTLSLFSEVVILKMVSYAFPIEDNVPSEFLREFVQFSSLFSYAIFPTARRSFDLRFREHYRRWLNEQGFNKDDNDKPFLFYGHGIGGAIAQISVSHYIENGLAPQGSLGFGVANPGSQLISNKFDISEETGVKALYSLIPERDAVTTLDIHPGLTQEINCDASWSTFCHSKIRAFCSLYYSCSSTLRRNTTLGECLCTRDQPWWKCAGISDFKRQTFS